LNSRWAASRIRPRVCSDFAVRATRLELTSLVLIL
jgi:hypothetical protein